MPFVREHDLAGDLRLFFLCFQLQHLSLILHLGDNLLLKLLFRFLPHDFLVVREILIARVRKGDLSCFLVGPEVLAFFVSALLVARKLRLLELVLEQSFFVGLPTAFPIADSCDQVM